MGGTQHWMSNSHLLLNSTLWGRDHHSHATCLSEWSGLYDSETPCSWPPHPDIKDRARHPWASVNPYYMTARWKAPKVNPDIFISQHMNCIYISKKDNVEICTTNISDHLHHASTQAGRRCWLVFKELPVQHGTQTRSRWLISPRWVTAGWLREGPRPGCTLGQGSSPRLDVLGIKSTSIYFAHRHSALPFCVCLGNSDWTEELHLEAS